MMKHTQLLAVSALMVVATMMSACGNVKNAGELSIINDDQAIVGGEPVAASEQMGRSTVALSHKLYGVFCSGTLIAKNLIVTAGHCTGVTRDPRNLMVVFSLTPNAAGKAETRKVLGGKAHDNWAKVTSTQDKNWGDVAVLRFEGTAPAGYEPASILGNPTLLKNGMDVTLAGFGLASMAPEIDPGKLMKTLVKLSDAKYSDMEVAFEQYKGQGACHGDSGGPAYATVNGRVTLMGVTSRSLTESGGNTCLEGSVYTSTVGVKDFMVSAAKFLNSPAFVAGQPIPQPQE